VVHSLHGVFPYWLFPPIIINKTNGPRRGSRCSNWRFGI